VSSKTASRCSVARGVILLTIVGAMVVLGAPHVVGQTCGSGECGPSSTLDLLVSDSPARSNPIELEGAILRGEAFVFVRPAANLVKVEFWLDALETSTPPDSTENGAPWDFIGGQSLADEWKTSKVADGPHSITVALHLSDGKVQTIKRQFTVANQAPRLVFAPAALSHSTYSDADQRFVDAIDLASNTALSADATLRSDSGWLQVAAAPSAIPTKASISIDTAGLSPGVYRGAVTATAPGLADATLGVTLNIQERSAENQVHLSWVNDPATTLTVTWWTADAATPSTVRFRKVDGKKWMSVTGSAQPLNGTEGVLHKAELTGLTPATHYEYQVQVGDGEFSDRFSTFTAHASGPASFDAVFVADLALIGRSDGLETGVDRVLAEIARIEPSLILLGGDLIAFATDKRFGTLGLSIDEFFKQMSIVSTSAPMMPAFGNHEFLDEGLQNWADRFALPEGFDKGRSYSFDVADAHFVSILGASDEGLSPAELQWVDNDLAAARTAGQRWLIAFFHMPPFSDGANHKSNTNLRSQLGPIFERHGVQLVLTAHDQSFERTFPLKDVPTSNSPTSVSANCYDSHDGVVYMKVSPGGKLSDGTKWFSPFRSEPPPAWTATRHATGHHFAHLEFSDVGTLRVRTYAIADGKSSSSVIDEFELVESGCEGQ